MEWLSLGIGLLIGWGVANIYNFFYILRLQREKIAAQDALAELKEHKGGI